MPTLNKMQLLLRDYERSRHSKQRNESWVSSKYDTQLQQTYVPSLHMRGQCCSALKRSWKAYEIAGRNGEPRGDIAWRIRNIQTQMGIEKFDFPELEGMETDDEETSEEETELRREEKEESGGDSNLNFGTNDGLNIQSSGASRINNYVERREREAEDDWWFS
ncbi:MAG: hypothetical protein WA364_24605 [Candidatus Nitrosopolaris sp.]